MDISPDVHTGKVNIVICMNSAPRQISEPADLRFSPFTYFRYNTIRKNIHNNIAIGKNSKAVGIIPIIHTNILY
jgi:hypothetical protein